MGDAVQYSKERCPSDSGKIYPKSCDQGIKAKWILQHMGEKYFEASNQIYKVNVLLVWSGGILQTEVCTKVST
eukprot:8849763-Ditylum_brightwellii.AAC.1